MIAQNPKEKYGEQHYNKLSDLASSMGCSMFDVHKFHRWERNKTIELFSVLLLTMFIALLLGFICGYITHEQTVLTHQLAQQLLTK